MQAHWGCVAADPEPKLPVMAASDDKTLNPVEVRVLGSLIEKEITTPDYYPLTLNALTNACNQSSNRDPVLSLGEHRKAIGDGDLRRIVERVRSAGATDTEIVGSRRGV